MKQQGLLDGVGLQMHVSTSYFPPPKDVAANIARLGALGLDVHITEMDVKCEDGCGDTQLAQQAQIYANMLHACLNHTACRSFETWGFTDKYTWLGSDLKPLPFDDSFQCVSLRSRVCMCAFACACARAAHGVRMRVRVRARVVASPLRC